MAVSDKGVVGLLEDDGEAHLVPVDADIVLDHAVGDQVLSVAGITHLGQCVEYEFRI